MKVKLAFDTRVAVTPTGMCYHKIISPKYSSVQTRCGLYSFSYGNTFYHSLVVKQFSDILGMQPCRTCWYMEDWYDEG